MIAKKAGLINVHWDGYLKYLFYDKKKYIFFFRYFRPSERFVDERRKIYASSLIAKLSTTNLINIEKQFQDSEDEDEGDNQEKKENESKFFLKY